MGMCLFFMHAFHFIHQFAMYILLYQIKVKDINSRVCSVHCTGKKGEMELNHKNVHESEIFPKHLSFKWNVSVYLDEPFDI